MKAGIWILAIGCLLGLFVDSMWTNSTDLAQHYSLVARLAEHWHLPLVPDRTLGEMAYYPRGAHALAALLSQVLHSDLFGMQLVVLLSVFAIWAFVAVLLLNLPGVARWWSAGALMVLMLANFTWHGFEFHGEELIGNYFLSQLMAQAGALAMVVATLYGERGARPTWQRNLLLLGACWVIELVHLLPVMQLLGFYALLLLFDALARRTLAGWLQALGWLLAGLVLVAKHPTFAAMKDISRNDGAIHFDLLNHMGGIIFYCVLVALVSALMLWRWYRLDAARRELWLVWKMVGALGLSVAGFCVLQALAWHFGQGSVYAVKKHLFTINTVALLELALWLGWYCTRFSRVQLHPLPHVAAAGLMVAAVCMVLPQKKIQDLSDLVAWEREMLTLRATINQQPGKYTYVLQLDKQPAFINYMYSIGIFRTPRFRAGYELWADQPFAKSSLLGTIITGVNSPLDRFPACRRSLTAHGLALVDYACLKREAGLVDTWFSLLDEPVDLPCKLEGFSKTEYIGRWTEKPVAKLTCVSPKLNGKPYDRVLLETGAFFGVPKQRLQVVQNGVPVKEFVYDQNNPHPTLEIDLQPDAEGKSVLELRLPDARSPQELGLSSDTRVLGILLETLEFRMK